MENAFDALVDGEQTYQSIFEGIEQAKDDVLVEFYIIRRDNTGAELKRSPIASVSGSLLRHGSRYAVKNELLVHSQQVGLSLFGHDISNASMLGKVFHFIKIWVEFIESGKAPLSGEFRSEPLRLKVDTAQAVNEKNIA